MSDFPRDRKRKRNEEIPGTSTGNSLLIDIHNCLRQNHMHNKRPKFTAREQSDLFDRFPLQTIEDLEDLEEELKRSDIGEEIAKLFRAEKDEEIYEYTFYVMKKLLAPQVASEYNLTGRYPKRAFQDLELYKVIIETVSIHAEKLYTQKIRTEIGKWLSNASQKANRQR